MIAFLGIINLRYTRPFNDILYKDPVERAKCFKDITVGSNDNLPNMHGLYNLDLII